MIEIINAIIIFSLITIIYKYFEKQSYDVVFVKANTNGKEYLVRNLPDKQEAADLIGSLALKSEKLVKIIEEMGYEKIYEKYMKADVIKETEVKTTDKDTIQGQSGGSSESQVLEKEIKMKLKEDIKRLISNYNPDALSETTPDAKYTSYSVNKGEKIVMCLRDKKQGEPLVKENVLLYVKIHELGHLMNKTVGHDSSFWNLFRLLIKIAVDNQLYEYQNYNSKPVEYCGINVTDSVLNK
jgi:hypothetical protein